MSLRALTHETVQGKLVGTPTEAFGGQVVGAGDRDAVAGTALVKATRKHPTGCEVVEDNHAITLVPCTLREAVGNERSIAIARRGIHRSKSFFIVALIRSIHPLQILFGSDRSVRINVKSSNADLRRVNSIEVVQVDVLFARHPKQREQKKQYYGKDPQ